jgi:hypothetical protein
MPPARSAVAYRISGRRPAPTAIARSWRLDPRRFGRAVVELTPGPPVHQPARSFAADLRLFAITFLAGFVFVSILLA